MKKLTLILSAFAIFLSTAIYAKTSNTMSLSTHNGKVIDINITTEGFNFKQYPNKTILLNFFGPMCPPCIIEIPHLIQLQNKHKDEIQVIAVQVQMPMKIEELKSFVKKHEINYPVINLNDAWDIVSFVKANTSWGGQIPFMLMFDKFGKLKTTYLGLVSNDKIIEDMKK